MCKHSFQTIGGYYAMLGTAGDENTNCNEKKLWIDAAAEI
jgi:hypothetical protein